MGHVIAVSPADGMRRGQPFDCLFQQQASAVQIAGTERGPTGHGSTE